MLCCIPTDTVNADRSKLLNIVRNLLLNKRVLRVNVGHTDFALMNLPAVAVIDTAAVAVPVLPIFKFILNVGMVACKVVGNNVNYNLNAIFVCFSAKCL